MGIRTKRFQQWCRELWNHQCVKIQIPYPICRLLPSYLEGKTLHLILLRRFVLCSHNTHHAALLWFISLTEKKKKKKTPAKFGLLPQNSENHTNKQTKPLFSTCINLFKKWEGEREKISVCLSVCTYVCQFPAFVAFQSSLRNSLAC